MGLYLKTFRRYKRGTSKLGEAQIGRFFLGENNRHLVSIDKVECKIKKYETVDITYSKDREAKITATES